MFHRTREILLCIGISLAFLGCVSQTEDDDADDDVADDDVGDDDACVDPVADPAGSVVGQTYDLDLGTAEFTAPPKVGGIFSQYIADVSVMLEIQVIDVDAGTVVVLLGSPPADATTGSWQNPYFVVGPADFTMEVEGYPFGWTGIELDGCFTVDGSAIEAMTLSGTLDTRALDDLIDPGAEEGAACELLASLEIECEPCPGDGDPYCLTVDAQHLRAERVD